MAELEQNDERDDVELEPTADDQRPSVAAVVVIFTCVLILWLLTPVGVHLVVKGADGADLAAARGQFGDLYGSINALFSGLAFAGVLVALLLQRQELRLQREELRLQRKEVAANRVELARAARAQEESREALRRTIYANAFKSAMDILQETRVRVARRFVLQHLRGVDIRQWDDNFRNYAETVCHTYDTVGIMIRHGMLPVEYIADSWGDSLRRTWQILQPFVEHYRKQRETPEYWADYERLVQEAEKFRSRGAEGFTPDRMPSFVVCCRARA